MNLKFKNEILDTVKFADTHTRKKLDEYVEALDFDVIKEMQVVIYVGRDWDKEDSLSPEEYYQSVREDFDRRWNTKEVETYQMLQKIHFVDYLKAGIKYLNLN